jgi:putative hydrolase of the HAD superfamily
VVIRGIVFDIDDTLYDEVDYVRSGFAHVSRVAAGPEVDASTLEDWLTSAFAAGVRGDSFDRLLVAYPTIGARVSAALLIEAYRAHHPEIRLDPTVEQLLDELTARGLRLGVLSDGRPDTQQAKVDALGLGRWFEPILLTGSRGPGYAKPATAGFAAIGLEWGLPSSALAYVGDNPVKDFAGPRRLGWTAIRVRHGRQLHCQAEASDDASRPDLDIGALGDLARLPGMPGKPDNGRTT